MKNCKSLFLLAASMLLLSCGTNSQSASTPASSSTPSSEVVSSSSEAVTSAASSLYDVDALKQTYGEFSITVKEEGIGSYTYDESAKTYYLDVASAKATYKLSGYFDGTFVIRNGSSLTSYKGVVIDLESACLVSTGDYAVINYTLPEKNVEIKSSTATSNKILALGSNVAVYSENNAEFSGKGTLELASIGELAHTVRAADKVRIYGEPTINVPVSAHDAFHGNRLYFTEDEDVPTDNPFLGTLNISNVISQAFDFETSSGNGEIIVHSGKINVDNAESVFKTDTTLEVQKNATVTATNLFGDPYVAGDNSKGLTTSIIGTFTVDGKAVE